jgi:hypothetical protein
MLYGKENQPMLQIKKDIGLATEMINNLKQLSDEFQENSAKLSKNQADELITNFTKCNSLLKKMSSLWEELNSAQKTTLLRHDILVSRLCFWGIFKKCIGDGHDFSVAIKINISPNTSLNPKATGIFIAGMAPEDIQDPLIRKDYEDRIRKNNFALLSHLLQSDLANVKKSFISDSQKFISKSYSEKPRNNKELIELLEKYEYPEEEKVQVLKDLGITYQSFREWQSKDDQIKITAKYISFDGQNVTLETKDKKRETIIFSNIREEDQKYVREQTNEKKEKR